MNAVKASLTKIKTFVLKRREHMPIESSQVVTPNPMPKAH